MQTIKQVSWEDISKQVEAVNPEFAKIVNTIEPVKSKYPLYVLTYRYGDMIDGPDGEFRFPVGDQLVDINSDLLDKQFQKDLGYSKNITPGGLLLSGAIELFLETDSRVIPRKMVMPGDLIAMWAQLETDRHFHPVQAMRSSVGARSIFMLPNIGDYSQHKNLKKDFNLKLAPPKALLDQWKVFKTLTANAAAAF